MAVTKAGGMSSAARDNEVLLFVGKYQRGGPRSPTSLSI
jgi:hypothetical protein